jgi:hypothetical protein
MKQEIDALKCKNELLVNEGNEKEEEILALVNTIQELSKRTIDLEMAYHDTENHSDDLSAEIDDLVLQLSVMEANKNDVSRMYNSMSSEMNDLRRVCDMEKDHRHAINDKLHSVEHMLKVRNHEYKVLSEEKEKCVVMVDIHKSNSKHCNDILHGTQKELRDVNKDYDALKDKYNREMRCMNDDIVMLNNHSNQLQINSVSSAFMNNVYTRALCNIQHKWCSAETTLESLENDYKKVVVKLDLSNVKLNDTVTLYNDNWNLLQTEVCEHDAAKVIIRDNTTLINELKENEIRLENDVVAITKKWQREKQSYNMLAKEVQMNSSVIDEMTEDLEKESVKRTSMLEEKDVVIVRMRKEKKLLDAEYGECVRERDDWKCKYDDAVSELEKRGDEFRRMSTDKKQLIDALKDMVSIGVLGQKKIDKWMNNPKGESGFIEQVNYERRKTEAESRRKGSIFKSVDLGEEPCAFNLALGDERLKASWDDYVEERRVEKHISAISENGSQEVGEVLRASLVIAKMVRRFDVLERTMRELELDNFKNCMKLKICKKEFVQAEEHWRNVNINLSKNAREESNVLKVDLEKKKNLLMAARKISESMSGKIKNLQKDVKTGNKKLNKSQNKLILAQEQVDMTSEDARSNSLRFYEVRRTQMVTDKARDTMHKVFTSVYMNMRSGEEEEDFEENDDDHINDVYGVKKRMQRKSRQSASLSKKQQESIMDTVRSSKQQKHRMLSPELTSVESLWLSPQQIHLESVVNGVNKINDVWLTVTHDLSVKSRELKSVSKLYKTVNAKYQALEKWAEKETIRKTGMKDFSSFYNSNLQEPKSVGGMTEVSWLHRVPQMNPEAATEDTFKERLVIAMDIAWDEKCEKELMQRKANEHHTKIIKAVGADSHETSTNTHDMGTGDDRSGSVLEGGLKESGARNLKSMMADVSRRETQNYHKPMNPMGGGHSPVPGRGGRAGGSMRVVTEDGVQDLSGGMKDSAVGRPPPVAINDDGDGGGGGQGMVTAPSRMVTSPKAPTKKSFWGAGRASVRVNRGRERQSTYRGPGKSPSPTKGASEAAPAVPNIYRHSTVVQGGGGAGE